MARDFPVGLEGQAPPEFGKNAATIVRQQIDLSVDRSNTPIGFSLGGEWLWAVVASSPDNQLDVRFHDRKSDPVRIEEGTFIKVGAFNQIYVTHSAQSNETIDLLAGTGDVEVQNPGRVFNSVQLTQPVPGANTFTSIADIDISSGGTQALQAADSNRISAMIQLDPSAAGQIRIGDSGVGTDEGLVLQPGETLVLDTEAAFSAHNPQGSQVTVHYAELRET